MNAWETLVASALVGTIRQEPTIDLTHPALRDYSERLTSQSATLRILSAAGLLATYESVGNSPASATAPLLTPAAADTLTRCSPSTTRYLSEILNDSKYEPILPELLRLLAKSGQTVPPDFLPLLLDLGKRERDLRSAILPILGDRGQWLANQNSKWKYAIDRSNLAPDPIELQEIWLTGTRAERSAALTKWRQFQPIESCLAVAASWKQDKADDRLAWLEVLQTKLSLADEEFLEIALFDRNESVRLVAVHLLNQLPSKYRQRLTKLADKCLTIEENGNNYKIEINYPKAGNKEWQDAGINDKISRGNNQNEGNISDEEWRFLQVISATDLNIWSGNIDLLVKTAVNLNLSFALLRGWTKAACYQKRTDWIKVLLIQANLGINSVRQLLQSLSKDMLDLETEFFSRILIADDFINNIHTSLEIMMSHNQEWSPEISSLVIRQFHKYIHKRSLSSNIYYREQNLSDLLGQYLDVSVLPELQQRQAGLSLENFSYNNCIELLEFRRDMRSAFNTA
ncbi:DUF5691 domain-containing protein [Chamaesiphon sp. VAR_48_metabat_403]|uniref:DUF5691 domain-containing protein n=1 Tax=Chamaesiphon sp. VAR_48_metabat_403 TaxID=2964700 RepID=UPI00286DCD87|nr:DUF5691 domain-containing protein [Chamaesiphon sp. VAR_48_metabat_403]